MVQEVLDGQILCNGCKAFLFTTDIRLRKLADEKDELLAQV